MLLESSVVSLIPVTQAERARTFYEESLGLRFIADDGFAVVFEAGGRFLRLTKVEGFEPQKFSIIAWQVADIAATVRGLMDRGVKFERYDGLDQDDIGVWSVPGGEAKVAWFCDPDGNVLSLVSAPQAKP